MNVVEELQHYVYTHAYPDDMGGYVFYIGKGIGNRIDRHEQYAKQGRKDHKCNVIRKIWVNGGQVIKTKVAFFATHKEALLYEQALIVLMRPYGHLTNLTDGGEGSLGLSRETSEKTRYKLSEAAKGKRHSEETLRKMSEKRRGKKFSEEHRRELSKARRTSLAAQEQLHKLHEAQKGRGHSEKTLNKMSFAHRQQRAQEHAQALTKMRYPVISSTDASWKQGVVQASLWEVGA